MILELLMFKNINPCYTAMETDQTVNLMCLRSLGSIPRLGTVSVADLVMQRIVDPRDYIAMPVRIRSGTLISLVLMLVSIGTQGPIY